MTHRPRVRDIWNYLNRNFYGFDNSNKSIKTLHSLQGEDFICDRILKLLLTDGFAPNILVDALFDDDLKKEYRTLPFDKGHESELWVRKDQEIQPYNYAMSAYTRTNVCDREIAILESQKLRYQPMFNGEPEEPVELHLRRQYLIRTEYRQRWVQKRNEVTATLKPIHAKYKKEIAKARRINRKEEIRVFWIIYQQQEDRLSGVGL